MDQLLSNRKTGKLIKCMAWNWKQEAGSKRQEARGKSSTSVWHFDALIYYYLWQGKYLILFMGRTRDAWRDEHSIQGGRHWGIGHLGHWDGNLQESPWHLSLWTANRGTAFSIHIKIPVTSVVACAVCCFCGTLLPRELELTSLSRFRCFCFWIWTQLYD